MRTPPKNKAAKKPINKSQSNYRELLIGCGSEHSKRIWVHGHETWTELTTLDINPAHKPDVVHDLMKMPLPFKADTFDEIHAYEVLEHTGRQGDYKFFFRQWNEFYRILKPNGLFFATSPSPNSPWAWGDPSHTRVVTTQMLTFLCQAEYTKQVGVTAMSDFRHLMKCDFEILHAVDDGQQVQFVIRKLVYN